MLVGVIRFDLFVRLMAATHFGGSCCSGCLVLILGLEAVRAQILLPGILGEVRTDRGRHRLDFTFAIAPADETTLGHILQGKNGKKTLNQLSGRELWFDEDDDDEVVSS